jgi:hypothetical protein
MTHHGTRSCVQSDVLTPYCDVCGKRAHTIHSPVRKHGFYCPDHCPSCHSTGSEEEIPSGCSPLILDLLRLQKLVTAVTHQPPACH